MVEKKNSYLFGRRVFRRSEEWEDDLKQKIDDLYCKVKKMEAMIEGYVGKVDDLMLKLRDDFALLEGKMELGKEFLSNEYVALANAKETEKKKVLVCGFYGAKNVGDELMLETILKLLPKKDLDITILLSNNYELDASEYAPYDVLHYPKASSDIMMIAKKFDVVVWGGGSMLDDVEYGYRGNYSTMAYILMSITKAVLKCGGHVFVFGVSSNERIEDKNFIKDLEYIIGNADYFSLRDTYSLAALKNAGISTDRIEVIDDISIYNLGGRVLKKNEKDGQRINVGLNLILLPDKMEESKKIIERITGYFKKPVKLIMIPFYSYQDYDKTLLQKVADGIRGDIECEVVEQPSDTDELMDLYSRCDYIVAMRYHAALIASLVHQHAIMIDHRKRHRHYGNKNEYIKTRYAPGMLVLDEQDLIKGRISRDVEISETGVCSDKIDFMSRNIETKIRNELKKIGRIK